MIYLITYFLEAYLVAIMLINLATCSAFKEHTSDFALQESSLKVDCSALLTVVSSVSRLNHHVLK